MNSFLEAGAGSSTLLLVDGLQFKKRNGLNKKPVFCYNKIMAYKPKKQLGQNFLADKKIIEKIIEKSGLNSHDIVLEIGPGQGSLTYALAQKVKKVIAVEKDEKLYYYLLKKFERIKNVEFVNEDILKFANSREFIANFTNKKYKIVGNIPYYLTSFLLRRIFELKNKPSEIILMLQKEVAERLVAKKGKMNLLAISVQIFAEPEILFQVSKNSFWPKPKVDSAVVKFSIFNLPAGEAGFQFSNIDLDKFFNLVHAGFRAKRKLLANNLAKGLDIPKDKIYDIFRVVGIDTNARAQDLSVEQWLEIYKRSIPNIPE